MLLWQPLKNEGEDTKKNKLIHCFYVEIVKCFVYHSKILWHARFSIAELRANYYSLGVSPFFNHSIVGWRREKSPIHLTELFNIFFTYIYFSLDT